RGRLRVLSRLRLRLGRGDLVGGHEAQVRIEALEGELLSALLNHRKALLILTEPALANDALLALEAALQDHDGLTGEVRRLALRFIRYGDDWRALRMPAEAHVDGRVGAWVVPVTRPFGGVGNEFVFVRSKMRWQHGGRLLYRQQCGRCLGAARAGLAVGHEPGAVFADGIDRIAVAAVECERIVAVEDAALDARLIALVSAAAAEDAALVDSGIQFCHCPHLAFTLLLRQSFP